MGIFRQFPYSNFHDMNMDSLIKMMKELIEEWTTYHSTWDDWKNGVDSAIESFYNWFNTLDVQAEINAKINNMKNTGELAQLIEPFIPDEVAAWLAEHITEPTGVVIDNSLTIEGAAADAKAAGDAIARETELRELLFTETLGVLKTTKTGKLIYIDDAFPDYPAKHLAAGAVIHSVNFGRLSGETRTSASVEFTANAQDPNSMYVKGTATNNAYSYGTITEGNAYIHVPAGVYYAKLFVDAYEGWTNAIKMYINDVTHNTARAVAGNKVDKIVVYEDTTLGIRIQVPSGEVVNSNTHFYFGPVAPEEYLAYKISDLMLKECVIINPEATDYVEYYSFSKNAIYNSKIVSINKSTADPVEINDAINDVSVIKVPVGCDIYSRNMYKINAEDRESRGVTFEVDPDDPNTVTVNGTATGGAAYSYTTITTENAANLLDPGVYWIAYFDNYRFGERVNRNVKIYLNVIDYVSGETVLADDNIYNCHRLVLTDKSYVALRVQVPEGKTADNQTIRIYFSKMPPLGEYVTHQKSSNIMLKHSVIDGSGTGLVRYYAEDKDTEPVTLNVGTFNVGGYNHGVNTDDSEPDLPAYAPVIADIDPDLFCTQEDRIYYTTDDTIYNELYKYMYEYGNLGSYSTSATHKNNAKGIYSNYPVSPTGAYTFTVRGNSEPDGTGYNFFSSFTYAFMLLNNITVLVISAHLAPRYWNGEVRKQQMQEIIDFIATTKLDHVIICGDFNTWYGNTDGQPAEDPVYPDEYPEFIDMWRALDYAIANAWIFGTEDTFYTGDHAFDNILVKNIKMTDIHAHANDLNDHYALTAKITVI